VRDATLPVAFTAVGDGYCAYTPGREGSPDATERRVVRLSDGASRDLPPVPQAGDVWTARESGAITGGEIWAGMNSRGGNALVRMPLASLGAPKP
jgi:hypothetical protein